ncbi:MAG: LysM peptidoglycan-binding domain-containing protein [Gemmatimonadaceae bacterium]
MHDLNDAGAERSLPAFATAPVVDSPPPHRAGSVSWPRIGAALSMLIVLAAIAAGAAALGLASHGLNNRAVRAREVASAAIRAALDSGELVQAVVPAFERHWWDYFVPSHGLLAVTQRRVLLADVSPQPGLLAGQSAESAELVAWHYDSISSPRRQLVFTGTDRGIVFESRSGRVAIGLDRAVSARTADSLAALIGRHSIVAHEARRCEARLASALAAPPPLAPESHTIVPGDALSTLARQYATTTAELRRINGLRTDEVRVGQVLVMRTIIDSVALRARLPVCPELEDRGLKME